MAIQVLAIIKIDDEQPLALSRYMELTDPLLERAGAMVLNRYTLAQEIVGQNQGETVVIVEYPSVEAMRSVFDAPEYAEAMKFRDIAFKTYKVSTIT